MMATTEIEKVPATIQSRSQVFELKTIGVKAIADQLRRIADAEQIRIDDAAVMLIARAGDGSMRDAQSAFDQVIAFAGESISAAEVSTVLGLVRRDLLFDMADAVAREDGAAAFELAAQAVESGYDIRLVVRELARLTRDILVVLIDPSRVTDPELAADTERDRLTALAAAFSAEDLMRAFEVLAKAEVDIRGAAYPRYHLEMALLRWIHLRRLVPITDSDRRRRGAGVVFGRAARLCVARVRGVRAADVRRPAAPASAASAPAATGAPHRQRSGPGLSRRDRRRQWRPRSRRWKHEPKRNRGGTWRRGHHFSKHGTRSGSPGFPSAQRERAPGAPVQSPAAPVPTAAGELKDAFLNEVRKSKKFFYGTVVAQAQRIDVDGDRVVFTFAPNQGALRAQLEQARPWLDLLASQLSGRRTTVVSAEGTAVPRTPGAPAAAPEKDRQTELRQQALADSSVQAMLDVFAAEIKDVEEM